MTSNIVVVGMARTPLGALQGALADISAPHLAGYAIKAALADANLPPAEVNEVLLGCVLPAAMGQAPARQAAIFAGLPQQVSATTINKVCGSGMKAIMIAADAIRLDPSRIVVAGGMESMSRAPHLLTNARSGYRLGGGEFQDHIFVDGLQDAYSSQLMGHYADATAERYALSREAQDAFALESLSRAKLAIENGWFSREITPIKIATRKGEIIVDSDELPANARPEKIPTLKPAFDKNGTVTAANASGIADGAAVCVLMSEAEAQRRNLRILATIKAQAEFAREPEWFTLAPVGAIEKVLKQTQWPASTVELFEINEAFACVTMAAMHDLKLDHARVNIHGGACALGHPLGASGARILVTLIAAMEQRNLQKGIASLCIGGGEATAMAVER